MDDRLRLELARVIYGTRAAEYAIDPAKPIRITVVNGNVTLTGVVDSKMDHDVAGHPREHRSGSLQSGERSADRSGRPRNRREQ